MASLRNRLLALAAAWALFGQAGPAYAGAGCGDLILNAASVTLWSGPIDQIGYALSYNASATVRVVCPITAVKKYAVPNQVSAGGMATFYICIDNQRMSADGSVWNVTITDRLPYGMGLDVANMLTLNYGVGALANSDISWSPTGAAGSWTLWSTPPPAGQAAPLYIKWRVPSIGTLKSGCVAFRATVL